MVSVSVGLPQMNLGFCELVRKQFIGTRNILTKNKEKTVREDIYLVCHPISLYFCVLARSLLGDTRFGSRSSF